MPVRLGLAGFPGDENWVEAGSDGGEEAVEFGGEPVHLASGSGDGRGFSAVAGRVGFDDRGDGVVEIGGIGESGEPGVESGKDAFLSHRQGGRVVRGGGMA